MNALLYSQNQQLQAWYEILEMILNIVIRFNTQFLKKKIATTFQVSSML